MARRQSLAGQRSLNLHLEPPESRLDDPCPFRAHIFIPPHCPSPGRLGPRWLVICAKAFRGPKSPATTPNPEFFPENPASPRNPPGIPTEFILSAVQNPTEFHWIPWVFPKFPEFPRIRPNSTESLKFRGNQGRRGIHAISHRDPDPRPIFGGAKITEIENAIVTTKVTNRREDLEICFPANYRFRLRIILFLMIYLESCRFRFPENHHQSYWFRNTRFQNTVRHDSKKKAFGLSLFSIRQRFGLRAKNARAENPLVNKGTQRNAETACVLATLAFLEKSQGNPYKKQRFFSLWKPWNPWKRKKKAHKKARKIGKRKKQGNRKKSKGWRVRAKMIEIGIRSASWGPIPSVPWVLFCPTFLSVRIVCVFCMTCLKLTKADYNLTTTWPKLDY